MLLSNGTHIWTCMSPQFSLGSTFNLSPGGVEIAVGHSNSTPLELNNSTPPRVSEKSENRIFAGRTGLKVGSMGTSTIQTVFGPTLDRNPGTSSGPDPFFLKKICNSTPPRVTYFFRKQDLSDTRCSWRWCLENCYLQLFVLGMWVEVEVELRFVSALVPMCSCVPLLASPGQAMVQFRLTSRHFGTLLAFKY